MSFHAEVSEMPSVLSTLEIRHANAACIIETVKLEVESAVIVTGQNSPRGSTG